MQTDYTFPKSQVTDTETNADKMTDQFLAAMRFNAISRGVKWIDTYHFTNRNNVR